MIILSPLAAEKVVREILMSFYLTDDWFPLNRQCDPSSGLPFSCHIQRLLSPLLAALLSFPRFC
jgi:hypothetical protein